MNEPWWMHPAYEQPGLALDQNTINGKIYEMFRNMERSPLPPTYAPPISPPTSPRFRNPFMGDDGMRRLFPWEQRGVNRSYDNIRENQHGGRFDAPVPRRPRFDVHRTPMRPLPRPDILGRLGRGEFDRFG